MALIPEKKTITEEKWRALRVLIEGTLQRSDSSRLMYATDGSAYKEIPSAVVLPKNEEDIKKLILFASENAIGIIPRTAGTSLAGQVVGGGIIADVSRHFTQIIEVNKDEHWVKVQPGVILDELNMYLKPYGLFFGPETSTANRCMIGGMAGNNACGSHSIIYGSTRDHILEIKGYLSDGTMVHFKALSAEEVHQKCNAANSLETRIYNFLFETLSKPEVQEEIINEYPQKEITRRNNGYALDMLLDTAVFSRSGKPFNLCGLIAGSEGTLCFITELKLNLVPLPPPVTGLVCVHMRTLEEALHGNLIALKYKPDAVELIDDIILECTKSNIEQNKNRFFLEGAPGAVLAVEFSRHTREEIIAIKTDMESEMRKAGMGYAFPLLFGSDVGKVWALRKAGLGLLSNIPGDAKPVAVIEDTAVLPSDLPAFISEFKNILAGKKLSSVYYAHIATGEIHMRPILNLKDPADVRRFREVAEETARLVKKYRGSLSGEHGDGRLRGEFIPVIIGKKNYEICRAVKTLFDPYGIFNPGKITDTPPMDSSLRFIPGRTEPEEKTYFDFTSTQGMLRLIEKCNGSGDCRKTEKSGGTMCPSYMATRDEQCTTRARANILREYITGFKQPGYPGGKNKKSAADYFKKRKNLFDHRAIYEILDLCLACKGCKSECPSGVDMAKLKSEFLQHWYDAHHAPLRSILIANITIMNRLGMLMPRVFNYTVNHKLIGSLIKFFLGFAQKRTIPELAPYTFRKFINKKNKINYDASAPIRGTVHLFIDEFTDFNDVETGIAVYTLLTRLGYRVVLPKHGVSARTYISKGFLKTAARIAMRNVETLYPIITDNSPLVGIESSAILGFRDEYPDLLRGAQKEKALSLAKNALLLEEFIAREMEKGNITAEQFTEKAALIKLHGHCQQKAVTGTAILKKVLSLPKNYFVEEIPSGCCGMAGSFGYEKEHYELSMKVGELVLFPAVRSAPAEAIICAPGTSCRHHIKDGTGRTALHPAEILLKALN